MRIGLAMSGGGFRATVFHLGVLARLAEEHRLEEVTFLSTVSGGSLCIGLVLAQNDLRWPSSEVYRAKILPKARSLLVEEDFQGKLIRQALLPPWNLLKGRAEILASVIQDVWGIKQNLSELPQQPRWMINATCYETGKNWRFERFRMGDYVFGYTHDTEFPISRALAASAGFPGLIGALPVDARRRKWFKYAEPRGEGDAIGTPEAQSLRKTLETIPPFPKVHLWDGGVYDNLGLEGLHDFLTGWRIDVDFLIVSDASGRARAEAYSPGARALLRIITGVMMDQIRSLRSRAVLERLVNHRDPGAFLQIGNTCREVLQAVGHGGEASEKCASCLSEGEANRAAEMETTIRRLSEEEFGRLFRHGFEVADYTLFAYNPDRFRYIGFADSGWR
jgi:NTE family protein